MRALQGACRESAGIAMQAGRLTLPCSCWDQAVAGVSADGRQIVNRAMQEATQYKG